MYRQRQVTCPTCGAEWTETWQDFGSVPSSDGHGYRDSGASYWRADGKCRCEKAAQKAAEAAQKAAREIEATELAARLAGLPICGPGWTAYNVERRLDIEVPADSPVTCRTVDGRTFAHVKLPGRDAGEIEIERAGDRLAREATERAVRKARMDAEDAAYYAAKITPTARAVRDNKRTDVEKMTQEELSQAARGLDRCCDLRRRLMLVADELDYAQTNLEDVSDWEKDDRYGYLLSRFPRLGGIESIRRAAQLARYLAE